MRPEALSALAGVGMILHAGDVGGRGVLEALRAIAPVHAVCGNVDDPSDPELPPAFALSVEGISVHVSHGDELPRTTPEALLHRYASDVVIFGHTHRALIVHDGPRLAINPGAAGPGRFDIKPSVARMTISGGRVEVEMVWI